MLAGFIAPSALKTLGKAEGEKMEAREVVLKMHGKHLSIEEISEMVGLNACEIATIITGNCS
jgi:hypothetical protein